MVEPRSIRSAFIFYAIACGLALVAALAASPEFELPIVLYMFTPLVAVLVMKLLITREGLHVAGWNEMGLARMDIIGLILAVVLPLSVLCVSWTAVLLTGTGYYQGPPAGQTLASLALALPLNIAGGAIFAFGEEAGWRGYLLPRLLPLGLIPAMLLSGFMHGAWHLPVILFTPFYHGDGSRLIVVAEFMILLTLAGVIYGYLRYRRGSLWPAVLGHAAFNTFLEQQETLTGTTEKVKLEYLGGESGLFMLLATAALAWALLHLGRKIDPSVAG